MSTARTTRLSRCRRTSVRLLSASGAASVVLASFLLGALDFALVKATTTPRRVEPFGLLDVELLTPTTPSTYLPQIADDIRRDPAPSDYLRTATTPLPWDQPENRPTRLSRPLSRSERDRQRRSKARRPQPQTAPAYKE